ncbi:MAG: hypothetical protein BWZ00_01173 [Bacteroidetes bacterium ADurb.BinA174]|jgi:hypothetical protein|nr:MAG: hypothetical protein BWZ00_01173 [Bacteroidetes bacterium ADurb.BinA174]
MFVAIKIIILTKQSAKIYQIIKFEANIVIKIVKAVESLDFIISLSFF